jgi:hypothetical protein
MLSIIVSQPVFASPQKMRLDPNIKVGQTDKISEIRDAGDWANPSRVPPFFWKTYAKCVAAFLLAIG